MNEDEFAELSAGHALAALSPDDERAYEAALSLHPEWASHADHDAEVTAFLAEGVSEVAPPLDLRSKLLSQIVRDATRDDAEPADADEPIDRETMTGILTPSTEMIQTVQRRNWTRGLFALVASIALLVGIGWGVGALTNMAATPAAVTALDQIESSSDAQSATTELGEDGEATVHWSQSVGKVVLVSDGLPTLPEDSTFELWYVRDGAPIAAGTFDAEDGTSTALLSGTMEPGDTIAVTVEQQGGSPTGAPTTDPIVAIETT